MSKNNYISDLLVLILTGSITLSLFKEKASSANIQELHKETGKSILHYIALSSRYEFAADAIKWLKDEFDIDLNFPDTSGNTMLFGASESGNIELIDYLAISGADFNHVNKQKESALFSIFHTFDDTAAEALLRNGVSVDIANIDGQTILDICSEEGDREEYDDLIELLTHYRFENSTEQTVKVYSARKLNKSLKDNTDSESATILLYNNMLNAGEYRTLTPVSLETFSKVSELSVKFPHFINMINYIKEQISLSLLSKEPYFAMKPLLMFGGPGVGKTRFNMELSKIIGLEIVVIDGGNVSGGFIIGGSSATWRDSSPGKVAKQIITGNTANPIVQLDEIDKMSSQQGFDPFGPLHPLLEYKTASEFVDEHVNIPIDCSYINWIATANNLASIPDTILSRFLVVKIPDPSKKQMVAITKSVYEDIIFDPKNPWGERFHDSLDKEVVCLLLTNTPREINRILLAAMGKVALKQMGSDDIDSLISIKKKDIQQSKIGKKSRMGMV